jgi:hypothetical protein
VERVNIELNHSVDLGRDVRVEGNRFGALKHSMFVAKGAGFSQSVGNIVIRNNVMEVPLGTCLYAIDIRAPSREEPGGGTRYWTGFDIADNLLRPRRGAAGIALTRVRDAEMARNTFDIGTTGGCDLRFAVRLTDAHEIRGSGNKFTGAGASLYTGLVRADTTSTAITVAQ